MSTEAWLRGPVAGVPRVLQPAAHALIQANEDVAALAPSVPTDVLWAQRGAATAGFHLLHLVGALDRLYGYARGEGLSDAQKAVLRAEAVPHSELDGSTLTSHVTAAVERALVQLRATDPERVFDERKVGRAGLPSTVLGLLFHGAEHTTRHAGQFITTIKLSQIMTILWWHWLVLGLLFMLGELVTPGGFYIIFFGIGAMLVGLLASAELGGPAWMQLLLFSVLSIALLVLFRARLLQWMQIDPQLPPVDALVGEVAVSSGHLEPGAIGKVELRGSSWSARNVSGAVVGPGSRCRVLRVDGLMLDVTPEGVR